MSARPDGYDELVARLAAADDPWEVLERAELDDPRLVEELRGMLRTLDAAGAAERAAVLEASRPEGLGVGGEDVDTDLVATTLRALAAAGAHGNAPELQDPGDAHAGKGEAPHAPRSAPPAWAWIGALVAAGLLVWFTVLGRGGRDSDPRLGADELRLVRPTGTVDEFAPFEWEGRLPEHGYFVVEVRGAGDGPDATVHASPQTQLHAWTPNDTTLETLGDVITWQVQVFDASGRVVHVQHASARRSSD